MIFVYPSSFFLLSAGPVNSIFPILFSLCDNAIVQYAELYWRELSHKPIDSDKKTEFGNAQNG